MGEGSMDVIGMICPAGPVKVALLPGCRIGAHVVETGVFEPETLAAWAEALGPGKLAIDVGSYTGVFAIAAAKRGAKCIALEPMPNQRKRLRENVKLNRADELVDVIPMAASDTAGVIKLWFNPRVALTSAASSVEKAGYESHSIYATRIDDLKLKDVTAIKIDAERHEAKVLRGAMVTITRDRPVIIAECLDDGSRKELQNLLPSAYRLTAILDRRNLLFKPHGK